MLEPDVCKEIPKYIAQIVEGDCYEPLLIVLDPVLSEGINFVLHLLNLR